MPRRPVRSLLLLSALGATTLTLAVGVPAASATTTSAAAGTSMHVATTWWQRHKASPTPTPTTSTPTPTPTPSTSSTTPTSTPTPTPTPTPTTSTPTPTPTPSGSSSAPAPLDCGGETPVKADGTPWTCTFDDEFNGTSVDRSKWLVQTTAASGYHSGAECFVDNPNNVSESGGALRLTVRKEASPFTCTSPSGNYTTQYTSGTVNTSGIFSQTYGRFEVRAQFPAATVQGLQETLWLWPVNAMKYGVWPASGEIDFAEVYSKYAGWNIPYLHYDVLQSTVNWNTNTNVYTALPAPYAQPGMNCQIAVGQFNTYTLTWSPGQLVIQVNGNNCIVDNYSATNVASPAPFDQPFFPAITQALGIGTNAFNASTTPLPATTSVDYLRIWQ